MAADLRQLITFDIDGQVLGIDVMAIREIRAWSAATPLPNTPAHVCGVVNLRGVVLPVIDLRRLLNWGGTSPSDRHVIIVVQIGGQQQGLIVDAVNDIVAIGSDVLQPSPDLAGRSDSRMVEGIATIEDRMVIMLALDRLSAEHTALREAA